MTQREAKKPLKVAIQGYEGCFHQQAAQQFFEYDLEVVPCATFREVVSSVENGHVDAGMMAIENSIAGSIMPNYSLLQNCSLRITGEIMLEIRQHLLALDGVSINQIEEIHSHPMALLQCIDYLENDTHNKFKLIEHIDTALAAKELAESGAKNSAAIAGELAAKLFGLNILERDIHTVRNNYTRFLALRRSDIAMPIDGANKASLYFKISHTHGSLISVLNCFKESNLNMTKLQSSLIPTDPFNYLFHTDMEFEKLSDFSSAMDAAREVTDGLFICGVYKKGEFIKQATL